MTAVCPTVPLDLGSPYSTLMDAKSPAQILRYGVDWSDWLGCNNPGATITASVWTIYPDDDDGTATLSQDTIDLDDVASVLLSGGTAGTSPRVVDNITLSDGQQISATIQIPIRDVFRQAFAAQ